MVEQFATEPAFGLLLAEDQDSAATQFIRAMQTAWPIRGAPPVVQSLRAQDLHCAIEVGAVDAHVGTSEPNLS